MMESTNFPGLAGHRAKHGELMAKLAEFASRHERGDKAMYAELLYFMRDWLSHHMQNEDREYALWFASRGVR
jgi:hemerythrin